MLYYIFYIYIQLSLSLQPSPLVLPSPHSFAPPPLLSLHPSPLILPPAPSFAPLPLTTPHQVLQWPYQVPIGRPSRQSIRWLQILKAFYKKAAPQSPEGLQGLKLSP